MALVFKGEFGGTERYELRRRIGSGSMGVVYEAYDREREIPVALKTLQLLEPNSLYKFKQEFRRLADVRHPNLASLYELASVEGHWFLTLELVDGVDFLTHVRPIRIAEEQGSGWEQMIRVGSEAAEVALGEATLPIREGDRLDRERLVGPLDIERLRHALPQLVSGVTALHRAGKLHRDIKPSNVLVTTEGRVVVLDFGLVVELSPATQTLQTELVGTAWYMSPEQARSQPLSEASDWYAVGAVLYEALTGQVPHPGRLIIDVLSAKLTAPPPAPREVDPKIPSELDRLCLDLLDVDPAKRPHGDEILERIGRASAVAPAPTPDESADELLGRSDALRRLAAAFESVTASGRFGAVYVRGASGMGKTALVRRYAAELRHTGGALVIDGRCSSREDLPYRAVDTLMDAVARHLRHMTMREALDALPEQVSALVEIFPVLSGVRAVGQHLSRQPAPAASSARELRRQAIVELGDLLNGLAASQPLVMILDDMQWGDAESGRLLLDVAHRVGRAPILLIGCHRSDLGETSPLLSSLAAFPSRLHPDHCLDVIELAPLAPSETVELARRLQGRDTPEARARAELVARESAGNPYYTQELVRFLRTFGTVDALAGPESVRSGVIGLLVARIQRLEPRTSRLLAAITLADGPIEPSFAGAAAAIQGAVTGPVNELRHRHLVRTLAVGRDELLEPRHELVRLAVERTLNEADRLVLHRRLAEALEAAGRVGPQVLHHWLESDEIVRAARAARAAGESAFRSLAYAQAARFFQLAIDYGARGVERRQLELRMAHALARAGRAPEAADVLARLAETAPPHEALELTRVAAEELLRAGYVDPGLKRLGRVLETLRIPYPETQLKAHVSLMKRRATLRLRGVGFDERAASEVAAGRLRRIDACWSVAMGLALVDTIRAADFQTRHLLLALAAGEPYRIARAMALEAAYSAALGERGTRRAERLLESARDLSQRLDNPHALGVTALAEGVTSFQRGAWRRALRSCEEAEQIFRESGTGGGWELHNAQLFSLSSQFYLGRLAALCEQVPPLLREHAEFGDLYAATNLRTALPHIVWLVHDAPEEGRRQIAEAMRRWTVSDFHLQHYYQLVAECLTDLYEGDPLAALRRLRDRWPALDRSQLLHVQHVRINMWLLRARAMLATHPTASPSRRKALLGSTQKLANRLKKENVSWVDGLALLLEAGVTAGRGDHDATQALLFRAEEQLEQAEMRIFAALAQWRRGHLLGGDVGRALVEAAEELMTTESIRSPERFCRAFVAGPFEALG